MGLQSPFANPTKGLSCRDQISENKHPSPQIELILLNECECRQTCPHVDLDANKSLVLTRGLALCTSGPGTGIKHGLEPAQEYVPVTKYNPK